jgi:hypothetical protein
MPSMIQALCGGLRFQRERVELLVPLGISLLRIGPVLYYVCATMFIPDRSSRAQPSAAGTREPNPQLQPRLYGYTACRVAAAIAMIAFTWPRVSGMSSAMARWGLAKVQARAAFSASGEVRTQWGGSTARHCARADVIGHPSLGQPLAHRQDV